MNSINAFWQVNIGQIASLVAILFTFWQFHRANVKRIEDQTRREEENKNKLDTVYDWITSNGQQLLDMKIQVEYIIRWFENTVINNRDRDKDRDKR